MTTPANPSAKERLAELLAAREARIVERDLAILEAETRYLESIGLFAGVPNGPAGVAAALEHNELVSREHDGQRDPFSGSLRDEPNDYQDGDFWPHWRTEVELAEIRGPAKQMHATNAVVINAIDTVANYVLGTEGFTYSVELIEPGAEGLAALCQSIVEEFLERVEYAGTIQPELFQRRLVEGERFLEVVAKDDGTSALRLHEPSWITAPSNAELLEEHYGLPRLHWKYGVATDPDNMATVRAYFSAAYGSGTQRVIPADEMLHSKKNVPTGVKRGLSDLYAASRWIRKSDTTVGNALEGAAIQAAIAMVRKHSERVTRASLERGASDVRFLTQRSSAPGSANVRAELWQSGTILDTQDVDYMLGPMGQPSGNTFVDVAEAGDRRFGVRWSLPYHMVSADASNANYASTLVAEAPFVKSAARLQGVEKAHDARLLWMVLRNAVAANMIPGVASVQQLRRVVRLKITAPAMVVRDQTQERLGRIAEHQAGLLSRRSAIEESDRDPEVELKRLDEEPRPDTPSPFGQALAHAAESWSLDRRKGKR
jgi:hypothetical protein